MNTSRPSVSPSSRQDRPYKGHRQQRLQTAQAIASSTSHEIENSRPQNCRGLSQPVRRAWTRDRVSTPVLPYHIYKANNRRTVENQEESHFPKLPPELRNKIYAYAFDSATARYSSLYECYYISRVIEDAGFLLQSCRQIRFEAKAVVNTFSVIRNPLVPRMKDVLRELQHMVDCSALERLQEYQMYGAALQQDQKNFTKCGQDWLLKEKKAGFPVLSRVSEIDSIAVPWYGAYEANRSSWTEVWAQDWTVVRARSIP